MFLNVWCVVCVFVVGLFLSFVCCLLVFCVCLRFYLVVFLSALDFVSLDVLFVCNCLFTFVTWVLQVWVFGLCN